MKKAFRIGVVVMMVLQVSCSRSDSEPAPQAGKAVVGRTATVAGVGITVVAAGSVEQALLDHAVKALKAQYMVSVLVGAPLRVKGSDLAAVVKEAAPLRTNGSAYVVVLAEGSTTGRKEGLAFHREKVGLVDIVALRPAAVIDSKNRAQYFKRIESETTRVVALLLGMSSCPFVHCSLHAHKTEEVLDRKSRNMCPPCTMKARKVLGVSTATPATLPVSVP